MHPFRIYKYFILINFAILLSLLAFNSCKEESNPIDPVEKDKPLTGTVSTGEFTKEITKDIGTGGGTIEISNSKSPINGFKITVPQKGYGETRNFSISTATITNHKLGDNFNPISPLITIKNGGGYSEIPMQIKIPIAKKSDEFIIAFLYDEVTGKIEALPVIELDASSITVETRHFASSSLSENNLGKTDNLALTNLVVSSIKESILLGQTILNTGFSPGVDDWEFPNYGSYLSTGGHCAGQAITAMWYFYEKRLKGEPQLFHNFDRVNEEEEPGFLWEDNPLGYRFASTIQEDFSWAGWVKDINIQSMNPKLTWLTFIASILFTGEPQFVLLYSTTEKAGHAMIVYKINVSEGKLYIADPNYPNNHSSNGTHSERIITYSNGKLLPYNSLLKVGNPGIVFDQIGYFAKTANIKWNQISKRYKELEQKTIGNDRLPEYDLYVKTDSTLFPLVDGTNELSGSLFEFYCQNTNIIGFLPGTDHFQELSIYKADGNLLETSNAKGIVKLNLEPGERELGFSVSGYRDNVADNYYDFKWITVKIEKGAVEGKTGDPCPEIPTVTYRGKTYNTVQIINPQFNVVQCWLKENLDVGTEINTNDNQTDNGIIEKYCYENSANCTKYGGLYQWNEAMQYATAEGSKGICPDGWHIPTNRDLQHLKDNDGVPTNKNGHEYLAIGEGRDRGTGTNESGFTGLLGGYRSSNKQFFRLGHEFRFWSSSKGGEIPDDDVWTMLMDGSNGDVIIDYSTIFEIAYSVRCLKDEVTSTENQPPFIPSNPAPIDGATGQLTNTSLTWNCSDPDGDPIIYDIYFGTSTNPSLVSTNQTSTTYVPSSLNENTKYYWKIVAKDDHNNETTGSVWVFTTKGSSGSTSVCLSVAPTVFYEGKTYNTIKIGDQCWLKENLNIGTKINYNNSTNDDQTNNNTIEKYCYDNDETNCDTYGGLYQWDEAMQYVTTEKAKGICPDGWHIPTEAEFEILKTQVGNDANTLKEIGQGSGSGSGTNTSGFSALLGGSKYGNFTNLSFGTDFWSSNIDENGAIFYQVFFNHNIFSFGGGSKRNGNSVRCLED